MRPRSLENVIFDGSCIFQRQYQNRTFPNRVHKKKNIFQKMSKNVQKYTKNRSGQLFGANFFRSYLFEPHSKARKCSSDVSFCFNLKPPIEGGWAQTTIQIFLSIKLPFDSEINVKHGLTFDDFVALYFFTIVRS